MEKEKTERQSDQTKSHPLIPLDLLKNFNEALHMITTPKILSKLSEAIKQKLQFLSNGIFSSESLQNQLANKETPIELKELFKKSPLFIKYSEKDLIKENLSEEFLNLSNLGIEIKLDLFIKTALQISPELQNILLSPNAKKGFLHVKFPGTLKSWHNKFLILDISKKMLFFLKEIKSLSPERGLKLEGYAIRWVGKSKSKFCFSILSPNIKPKCILFGGEQEKLIKEWYESLKNVMNQNGSATPNYSQIKAEQNPSVSDDEDNNSIEDEYEEEGFKSDIDNNRKKSKQRIRAHNSDNDNISDPEIIPTNKTLYKTQIKKKLDSALQTSNTFNPLEILTIKDEIEQKAENKEFLLNPYIEEKESTRISPQKKQSIFRSIDSEDYHLDQTINNEEIDDLRVNKSRYPPLIEPLLSKVTTQELTNEIGFHLSQSTGNIRILQHDTEPHTFKVFINLNYDLFTILSCFLDQNNYRNWNNTIVEYKTVHVIDPLSSIIIYEKRNPKSSYYKLRNLYYSRTLIPMQNMTKFIIIDKSIPHPVGIPHSFWETPAFINFNLISIFPHPKKPKNHLLVVWTQVDNKGLLLTNLQNDGLTLKYLAQFSNLENFLAQKAFFNNNSKLDILNRYAFLQTNNSEDNYQMNESKEEFELCFEPFGSENMEKETSIIQKLLFEKSTIIIEEDKEEYKSEINTIDKNKTSSIPLETNLLELVRSNQHINQILKHNYQLLPFIVKENMIKYQAIDGEMGHYAVTKDWSRTKEGGLLWYNKKELEIQGKVLSFLIKKLGSNLLQGKSMINISLPIDLFDTQSFLERIAYSYTYAPYFLEPNPSNLDPTSSDFERPGLYHIYQVLCFVLSTLHLTISQKKPFNPILGETFQGWIKGCPIFCEQISHHPPASSFLMLGQHFKIQGNFEITASMNPNSVTGKQLGLGQVVFNEKKKNEKKIYFSFPPCVVSGLTFGSRIVNYEGKSWIFDEKERIVMDLSFNPDKKGILSGMLSKQKTPNDYFKGVVYEMKEAGFEKMIKGLLLKKFNGINFKEDIIEGEISVCEGIWHDHMEIKGRKYWDFKDYQAYKLEHDEKALPSDCLYREDLIIWGEHNLDAAQKMKDKLETIQRNDRKLREKIRGKKH